MAGKGAERWRGEDANACFLGARGDAAGGLALCMSFLLLHKLISTLDVEQETRLTCDWAWRIKFQPEYIFAELIVGWLVGFQRVDEPQLGKGPDVTQLLRDQCWRGRRVGAAVID